MRKTKRPPHEGVYARLRPSKIHGVGVFAIRRIKKGTYVFPGDDSGIVWTKKSALKGLPTGLKQLYRDFAIVEDHGRTYGAPKSFNSMPISWYLNHAENPNLGCDKNFEFFALRDIKNGEELTADYNSYNDFSGSGPTGTG